MSAVDVYKLKPNELQNTAAVDEAMLTVRVACDANLVRWSWRRNALDSSQRASSKRR